MPKCTFRLGSDSASFKAATANVVTRPASDYRSCITAAFLLKTVVFLFALNLASSQQLAEFLCSIPNWAARGAAQDTVYSICSLVFCIPLRLLKGEEKAQRCYLFNSEATRYHCITFLTCKHHYRAPGENLLSLKKKWHALLKSKEMPCCRWIYSWLQHREEVFAFPPPPLIQISSPGLQSMRWATRPCNDRILMWDWCTKSNAAASLFSVLLCTLDIYVTLLLILKAVLT